MFNEKDLTIIKYRGIRPQSNVQIFTSLLE